MSTNDNEQPPLTDKSLMPNGQYKGEAMVNVPASHLLWIYENDKCRPEVKQYVKNNLDTIKKQIKQSAKLASGKTASGWFPGKNFFRAR